MYLYFDSNGYLKEFISDPAREGSQNVNKLYIFVEPSTENIEEMEINGETVHVSMFLSTYPAGTADFRLADSDTGEMNSLAFTLEDDSVYEQIPFNLKRDLKFFKYYKYYQFVKLTVPPEVLTDAGEVNCSISLIDPDTSPTNQFRFVMDTFSFKVQDSVVLKNINITQAQYSYLLASKLGYADTTLIVDELPETGRSNVVYIVNGSVYRWNPQTSEYIWIGSSGTRFYRHSLAMTVHEKTAPEGTNTTFTLVWVNNLSEEIEYFSQVRDALRNGSAVSIQRAADLYRGTSVIHILAYTEASIVFYNYESSGLSSIDFYLSNIISMEDTVTPL